MGLSLEANSPAPAKMSDDCSPGQHLMAPLYKNLGQTRPTKPKPCLKSCPTEAVKLETFIALSHNVLGSFVKQQWIIHTLHCGVALQGG